MKRVHLPRLHCALLGLLPMLPEDRGRGVTRLVWRSPKVRAESRVAQCGVGQNRKGTK